MNITLAEDIMGLILMHPEQLDMDLYVDAEGDTVQELRDSCGTTACIAGWAALLTLPADVRVWDGNAGGRSISEIGREALQLGEDVADVLFHDTVNDEAVPALKFLIGRPDATAGDLEKFLDEGRDDHHCSRCA